MRISTLFAFACGLATLALARTGGQQLYGISTGTAPNKLGDLVTIDARDGTTKVVGSLSGHPGYTVPNDIVRAADGAHFYVSQLEIADGWARTHLLTIDAKSLKVERSVLLGEAFDALVVDGDGRLLAARFDKDGSALVSVDPKTGASTLVGRQGREWELASLSLEPRGGKLLGLALVLATHKHALVRIDPATAKVVSSVELALAEQPDAMTVGSDGLALIVTDGQALFVADPATGVAKRRAPIGNVVVVGLHAE